MKESELNKSKTEATTQRKALLETLAAHKADNPEPEESPPPENNIRKKH